MNEIINDINEINEKSEDTERFRSKTQMPIEENLQMTFHNHE